MKHLPCKRNSDWVAVNFYNEGHVTEFEMSTVKVKCILKTQDYLRAVAILTTGADRVLYNRREFLVFSKCSFSKYLAYNHVPGPGKLKKKIESLPLWSLHLLTKFTFISKVNSLLEGNIFCGGKLSSKGK